jgi:excinuclease UvrABC ATPase subunit
VEEEKSKDGSKDKDPNGKKKSPAASSSNDNDDAETETVADSISSTFLAPENGDHRFELRDMNVRFPEGELSVITGPTASGKTALLVCFYVR